MATTNYATFSSGPSGNASKKQLSIHKIRDLQLETVNIEANYDVLKEIGSGDYGKVILAAHKLSGFEVALKAVPRATTTLRDFLIEFHYSYFLSPHYSILDTYDVAFETRDHYYFVCEVAPFGDLWNVVERTNGAGLDEKNVKIVIEQMVSALQFMHELELVHRDVRAENILIFNPDLTKVKLTDFGLTRRVGTTVKKRVKSLPSCPPEVWQAVLLEGYSIETGSDVWQLAIMLVVLLTAKYPWDKADITDPIFNEFVDWQKRKSTRTPRFFRDFTPRVLRMFRRLMEVKPSKRYPVTEVRKYIKDRSPTAKQTFLVAIPAATCCIRSVS
ncbi:PREDICTED: serine/threonine-protein kinase SBK1-like [Rhagoletis zephyria]|uniref:serine/threonine-protein kinase SBK1-like n=1 Tax=Rhagoletis zephyria TaxID=28612 RepID=UPI0008118426|nr:PREDICTED: serine/threonine-protein kinase SBK1-like [Rhagoletis zephyria]